MVRQMMQQRVPYAHIEARMGAMNVTVNATRKAVQAAAAQLPPNLAGYYRAVGTERKLEKRLFGLLALLIGVGMAVGGAYLAYLLYHRPAYNANTMLGYFILLGIGVVAALVGIINLL
jgi:hypothetical protein